MDNQIKNTIAILEELNNKKQLIEHNILKFKSLLAHLNGNISSVDELRKNLINKIQNVKSEIKTVKKTINEDEVRLNLTKQQLENIKLRVTMGNKDTETLINAATKRIEVITNQNEQIEGSLDLKKNMYDNMASIIQKRTQSLQDEITSIEGKLRETISLTNIGTLEQENIKLAQLKQNKENELDQLKDILTASAALTYRRTKRNIFLPNKEDRNEFKLECDCKNIVSYKNDETFIGLKSVFEKFTPEEFQEALKLGSNFLDRLSQSLDFYPPTLNFYLGNLHYDDLNDKYVACCIECCFELSHGISDDSISNDISLKEHDFHTETDDPNSKEKKSSSITTSSTPRSEFVLAPYRGSKKRFHSIEASPVPPLRSHDEDSFSTPNSPIDEKHFDDDTINDDSSIGLFSDLSTGTGTITKEQPSKESSTQMLNENINDINDKKTNVNIGDNVTNSSSKTNNKETPRKTRKSNRISSLSNENDNNNVIPPFKRSKH